MDGETGIGPTILYLFTTLDLLFFLWSILTYCADVFSDIYLCVEYFISGEITYFVLTLIFVAVPAFIIATMNIYILVIYYAWKSKKAMKNSDTTTQRFYSEALVCELGFAKILNLFECYTESAPQMLLQIYIVLNTSRSSLSVVPRLISITFSYISLSWCMTAFARTQRLLETGVESISLDGTVVHFLSQLLIIGPRMMALGFFASLYPMWIGLIIGTHFMMMFLWYLRLSLYMQDPCATLLSDIFKSGIYAAMGIFNFLNFDEQPTKTDVFYYTSSEAESEHGPSPEPINELVIEHMMQLPGVEREAVVHSILASRYDNLSAIYYLLLEKLKESSRCEEGMLTLPPGYGEEQSLEMFADRVSPLESTEEPQPTQTASVRERQSVRRHTVGPSDTSHDQIFASPYGFGSPSPLLPLDAQMMALQAGMMNSPYNLTSTAQDPGFRMNPFFPSLLPVVPTGIGWPPVSPDVSAMIANQNPFQFPTNIPQFVDSKEYTLLKPPSVIGGGFGRRASDGGAHFHSLYHCAEEDQEVDEVGTSQNGPASDHYTSVSYNTDDVPSTSRSSVDAGEIAADAIDVVRYMQCRGNSKRHTLAMSNAEEVQQVQRHSRTRRTGLLTVTARPPVISPELVHEVEKRMKRQHTPPNLAPLQMPVPGATLLTNIQRAKTPAKVRRSGLTTVVEGMRLGREAHTPTRDRDSLVPPPSFQRRASDGCASIGQLNQPVSDVKSLQQEFHNLQRSSVSGAIACDMQLRQAILQHRGSQGGSCSPRMTPTPPSPTPGNVTTPVSIPGSPLHQSHSQNDGVGLSSHLQRLHLQSVYSSSPPHLPLQSIPHGSISQGTPVVSSPSSPALLPTMTPCTPTGGSISLGTPLVSPVTPTSTSIYGIMPGSITQGTPVMQPRSSPPLTSQQGQQLGSIQEEHRNGEALDLRVSSRRRKSFMPHPQISVTDEMGEVTTIPSSTVETSTDRQIPFIPELHKSNSGSIEVQLSSYCNQLQPNDIISIVRSVINDRAPGVRYEEDRNEPRLGLLVEPPGVQLALEVCEAVHGGRGLKIRRISGDSFQYDRVCQELIACIALS